MKHVMLKTYDDYKKILPLPSTFVYKKYGTINITSELKYNTWYTLDNEENIAETNNSYTSARHELTNQKYSLKKNMKTCKLFMILEITPSILLPFYKRKNNKNIHNLSEPALAYLMLYAGKSNLVFDNAKGILIYSCLYFTNNVTTDDNRFFEILRCYNKEFKITESDGLFCINNYNKSFDTVFMIGQNNYVGLIEEKKHLVANILIIYFNNKEEASEVFEHLVKHNEFVDVSFVDFFAREWKIDTTVRPEMRNDIENGYVVRATKVDR